MEYPRRTAAVHIDVRVMLRVYSIIACVARLNALTRNSMSNRDALFQPCC